MSNAMSEQRISDERIQEARTRAQQRAGDFHMAWLLNPRFVEADSDVHALLAAVVERDQELATLRRPVVQSAEVEGIRQRQKMRAAHIQSKGNLAGSGFTARQAAVECGVLLSALDAAQREIAGLKILVESVPEERRDISERQAERKRHAAEGWTSFTQYMSDIDLLLSDNIRLRNAHADRVRMLGFTQDELTARNKECVELRQEADLHEARKDLVTQQAQSIVEQRVRIEQLEAALVILCDCANALADEHGSLLCFDSMHKRIADARAALAAADGQQILSSDDDGKFCENFGAGDGAAGE